MRNPRPDDSGRFIPLLAAAVLAVVAGRPGVAAAPPFVLDLPDGGSLPGAFVPLAEGEEPRTTILWRSPAFTEPFEFHLDEIVGIRSTAPVPPAREARGLRCRLQGGDIVDGELRHLDADHLVLAVAEGDELKIDRRVVSSLVRGGGAGAGYVGPGGLAGWDQSPASSWRDEAGRILSDVSNAVVSRDVGGPSRARYDIVLSWQNKPEIRLAVAAGDGKAVDPYRLEMLAPAGEDPVVVVIRQDDRGGMLEPVELPAGERGRLRLTLFVDQAAGRLAAVVPGGERVIDLTVEPPKQRKPATGFRLQLISGDVRLERLRVSEWKSADPVSGDPEQTRVVLRDGTAFEGEVVAVDDAGKLLLKTAAGEQTPAVADVEEIAFATTAETPDAAENRVRVVRQDGGVLSGEIVSLTEQSLAIRRAGIDRPVAVPLAQVHSLVSLVAAEPRPLPGRAGRIVVGDALVPGCLVDAARWGGGLAWQPRGSLAGSPLAGSLGEILAVVEYVAQGAAAGDEAAGQVEVGGMGAAVNQDEDGFFIVTMLSEDGAAARDGRIEPGERILAIRPTPDGPFLETKRLPLEQVMNLLRGKVGTPLGLRVQRGDDGRPRKIEFRRGLIYVADKQVLEAALAAHAAVAAGQLAAAGEAAGFPAVLVLRSGDVVTAAIERVDDQGVSLRSPATGNEPITVAARLVRAIELDPVAASKSIAKSQWERLLTLPRSQQADPPGHLLRLSGGDYLRGRLESLDGQDVKFSVLGQSKRIPRAAVVRIIWLHADEIEGLDPDAPVAGGAGPAAEPAADAREGLLVQGVAAGGGRTTLFAERMEGPAIVGTSLALGPSRIDTRRVDRLRIGNAVGAGDDKLPFAQWRLKLAPLPRALRDEE